MDCAPDCAVTGETAVARKANRGEQVEGEGFSVTGRGDPALSPQLSSSPHGTWKNLDKFIYNALQNDASFSGI